LNLVAAAPLWLILIFAVAMVAAAIEDARRYRIANLTSLVVLAGAIVAALLAGPTWALWKNAAVFAVILAIGTAAFSARLLGGGDVKLFAAAGLWFDPISALMFVALVLLSGGVVALAYVATRSWRLRGADKKSSRVPYGIAIALGALAMVLLDSRALRHHERPLAPLNIKPHQS
jgi:prepilin peptidase CpaA